MALGNAAGAIDQSNNAIAIGGVAGNINQGPSALAIGYDAGNSNQGPSAVAIGVSAGKFDQSNNAIAIGGGAGTTRQGPNAIAIGTSAGSLNQPSNSIVINATGATINGNDPSACYIAPIRDASGLSMLMYDGSTNEVTYGNTINGSITSTSSITAASFVTSSDYRIKENVELLDETFSVDNLKPVHYTNIVTNKHDIGFLAHEVQKEFPYLVSGERDGPETQALNYQGLIGVLVKEIQELKKRVLFLEEKT